jgi:2-polyprenyl-3-methyl-5-hydroxy-6-metoxy-1,4-benzoquinol methylase
MAKIDTNLCADTDMAEFDYNSIETGYYDRIFRKEAGMQSKWHHQKFAFIRDRVGSATHHLDIACGPGTFVGTINDTVESIGVDIAAPQIDYARTAYGTEKKKFEIVGPGELPYGKGHFDIATCVELLEHLTPAEGKTLLLEAKRVIKPDGLLLLSTPDYGGAWPMLEWILNRRGDVSYEDQHITHYTKASLKLFLEQAGYKDVRVERYLFLSPFLAPLGWGFSDWFAKVEPRWLTNHLGFLLFATATPD